MGLGDEAGPREPASENCPHPVDFGARKLPELLFSRGMARVDQGRSIAPIVVTVVPFASEWTEDDPVHQ